MPEPAGTTGQPPPAAPAAAPGQLAGEGELRPPIDAESLLRRCQGKSLLAERLLATFEQQLRGQVDPLRQSLEMRDRERLARLAHTVKGSAANMSAASLSDAAAELEQLGAAADYEAAASSLQRLAEQVHQCLGFIPKTVDLIRGLSAGADEFMTKPFEPEELLARMQAAERLLSLETRDVAIFAMAKLAESRDVETGAHLERVMSYSRVLAQQLPAIGKFVREIDPEFVRLVYGTSPLHDIGKVGIPDGVLLKPGRLDDREFEIMKTHATIGASTLDAALRRFPNAKFLRMARDIAATHHERYDGKGYPAGLKGEDIPLCGRIVALADVYDALTSKRVYKNAFAHEVARGIIIKDAGTHFDPAVAEAFQASEQAFVAIHEQYREGREGREGQAGQALAA